MPPPAGAACAFHLESAGAQASYVCERCGTFFCEACARRTRPEAIPMCPSCWALREQNVKPQEARSATRLHTAGFVLGIIAILPIPVLQIAALVVNIIALVKSNTPETRDAKWKPIAGLLCTVIGLAIDVAAVSWVIIKDST